MGKADDLKKASQRNVSDVASTFAEGRKPREKAFSGHGVSKTKTVKTSITVSEDVLLGMQTLARMKSSNVSKMVGEIMSKMVEDNAEAIEEFNEKYGV